MESNVKLGLLVGRINLPFAIVYAALNVYSSQAMLAIFLALVISQAMLVFCLPTHMCNVFARDPRGARKWSEHHASLFSELHMCINYFDIVDSELWIQALVLRCSCVRTSRAHHPSPYSSSIVKSHKSHMLYR